MATTKEDIRGWLEAAKKQGATHLLVVCDTFDWEDYPVEVYPKDLPLSAKQQLGSGQWFDVKLAVQHFNGPNMQKVMEVYDLGKDIEGQLNIHRAGQEYLK